MLVSWFDAMRAASAGEPDAEDRYRAADERLADTGMPGVRDGLLALALLGATWRCSVGPDGAVDPGS